MFKKLMLFTSLAIVLAIANPGLSDLFYDFEGTHPFIINTDGDDGQPLATVSYSDIGVTSGSSSLKVTPKNITGFDLALHLDVPPLPYHTIMLDVTWVAAEWVADGQLWSNLKEIQVNSEAGESGNINPSDPCSLEFNPDWPGTWDPNIWDPNINPQNTRTLSWDIFGFPPIGSDWMEIEFSLNAGGVATSGSYYIDNLRILGPDPVLKLDMQPTDDPNNVEEGFTAFTPADSGTAVNGITVELGDYGEGDVRRRGEPNGVPYENIYKDFIFGRQQSAGVGHVSITLSGLVPNSGYEVKMWSWDTFSTELRISDWSANGKPLLTTQHDGNVDPPAAEEDYAFSGVGVSDDAGVLVLDCVPGLGTFAAEPFGFVNALCVTPALKPATKIVWVTDTIDRDGDGIQDDLAWVDMLTDAEYDVDFRPDYWNALEGRDANDVNDYIGELNVADIVIISRTANSGNYDDGNEPTLWNSITTPMVLMSTHIARNNRWLWFDTTDLLELLPAETQLLNPDHPIFAGLGNPVSVYDPNVGSGSSNFLVVEDAGNGTALATGDGLVQVAEWPAGVEFYEGAGQWAGDHRFFVVAGTQEIGGEQPQGALNLNDAGQQLFLNILDYLIPEPADTTVQNASFEQPGTTKQSEWASVPGWNTDDIVDNSGVDNLAFIGPTDGEWYGYLTGSDVPVYQTTNYIIHPGDVITLKVDTISVWLATTLRVTLYYPDGFARIPVATKDITLGFTFEEQALVFNASDIPAAFGRQLGIEFNNVTDPGVGDNQAGVDNVRLTVER